MPLEELRAHVAELEGLTGLTVEVTSIGVQVFLVLREVVLPVGVYEVEVTDALFITDHQYPMSAMDMFWTEPDVLLPGGAAPQNADQIETYLDRQWRRFSWHRNGIWDPSRNGLVDHFEFTMARFAMDASAVGP